MLLLSISKSLENIHPKKKKSNIVQKLKYPCFKFLESTGRFQKHEIIFENMLSFLDEIGRKVKDRHLTR